MFLFPIINAVFLIILYRIHGRIFYITLVFEVLLYIGSWMYIDYSFTRADNQFLYWLTVTGIGFIFALTAFFTAISLNHKNLYDSNK